MQVTDKLRMSKKDIYSMLDEIKRFTPNFDLDKTYNPTGTLKYWNWDNNGIILTGLTTHQSYWLLKGMVDAFHSNDNMTPEALQEYLEQKEKEMKIALEVKAALEAEELEKLKEKIDPEVVETITSLT